MPEENKDGIDPKSNPKYFLDSRKLDLEEKKLDYEMMPGWLGRVIGSSKNAGNNIAFAVVLAVIVAGIIASFFPGDRVEFWKVIVPIITLALGYVFGQNASKS
jgi:hypothetical protein